MNAQNAGIWPDWTGHWEGAGAPPAAAPGSSLVPAASAEGSASGTSQQLLFLGPLEGDLHSPVWAPLKPRGATAWHWRERERESVCVGVCVSYLGGGQWLGFLQVKESVCVCVSLIWAVSFLQ